MRPPACETVLLQIALGSRAEGQGLPKQACQPTEPWPQVMIPGKQNYSLTWAWSLPYDPVKAVNDALLKSIPEDQGALLIGQLTMICGQLAGMHGAILHLRLCLLKSTPAATACQIACLCAAGCRQVGRSTKAVCPAACCRPSSCNVLAAACVHEHAELCGSLQQNIEPTRVSAQRQVKHLQVSGMAWTCSQTQPGSSCGGPRGTLTGGAPTTQTPHPLTTLGA